MFAEHVTALSAATDAELDEQFRQAELLRRHLDAHTAALITAAEHRGLHQVDGHRSMAGYLRATCNWSKSEIAQRRGAARLANAHPDVGDVLDAGHIGAAQVAELSRVHGNRRVRDRLDEFLPILLDQAETLPHPEFQVLVQRFTMLADTDGTHDDRDAIDGRTARVTNLNGSLDVRASGGDALTTAEFTAIFDRFVEAEFQAGEAARRDAAANGDDVPVRRTRRQLQFDAMIAMSRSAAAHDGFGSPTKPLVSILCDQHTWSWINTHTGLGSATTLDGKEVDPFTGIPQPSALIDDLLGSPDQLPFRRCETSNGVPLHPNDVLRAAFSGHVRRVVFDAASVPINLGRSSRVFTGAARDAARLLVDWCDHPGCDIPASLCQVDHSVEWSADGRTDQHNAGIECGFHNREKHRSKRRTRRGTNGQMYTIRADGTIILPVGCRPPTFVDDPTDLDDDLDDLEDAGPDLANTNTDLVDDDLDLHHAS